jgi:urea transport system substrate-binding protein
MSVSIAEDEIRGIGADNLVGHYEAWNYFFVSLYYFFSVS